MKRIVVASWLFCAVSGSAQNGLHSLTVKNESSAALFTDRWPVDERDTPLIMRARVLLSQHRYADAVPVLEQALDVQREIPGVELAVAGTSFVLAQVLLMLERPDHAEPLHRKALEVSHRLLGKQHPSTALAYKGMGDLHRARKQFAEAESSYSQALSIFEKASGAVPQALPNAMLSLVSVLLYERQDHRAESMLRRCLPLIESLGDDGRLQRAYLLNFKAILEFRRGNLERSIQLAMQSLPDLERLLGPNHSHVGNVLFQIGGMHIRRKEYAAAEPVLSRALKIAEGKFGPADATAADIRSQYAHVLRKLKRKGEAQAVEAAANSFRRN